MSTSLIRRAVRALYVRICPDDARRTQILENTLLAKEKRLRDDIEAFMAYKKSVTITDMVRERLHGFNPKLLDRVSEDNYELYDFLYSEYGKEGVVEAYRIFCADMNALSKNESLRTLIAWIERNQVLTSAREAQTLEEINLGRATLNGTGLILEEIERHAAIHREPRSDAQDTV